MLRIIKITLTAIIATGAVILPMTAAQAEEVPRVCSSDEECTFPPDMCGPGESPTPDGPNCIIDLTSNDPYPPPLTDPSDSSFSEENYVSQGAWESAWERIDELHNELTISIVINVALVIGLVSVLMYRRQAKKEDTSQQ